MSATSRKAAAGRGPEVVRALIVCGTVGVGLYGVVARPAGPAVGRVSSPSGSVARTFASGHPWLPDVKPGDRVEGWVIDSVHTPRSRDGDLAVRFLREGVSVTVFVAPKGSTRFNPPTSTERYDLFVNQDPSNAELEGARSSDLLTFVADRVREAEARGDLVPPSYRPHG